MNWTYLIKKNPVILKSMGSLWVDEIASWNVAGQDRVLNKFIKNPWSGRPFWKTISPPGHVFKHAYDYFFILTGGVSQNTSPIMSPMHLPVVFR